MASLESNDETTITTAVTATEEDAEEAALAFAQCMRDHGIANFPDPMVDGGGAVGFGFRAKGDLDDSGIDPQSEEVQAAFEACSENLEGVAFGGGAESFDATELQDQLLEMAQCLRDHGLEVDDPDMSTFGPRGGGDEDDETFGPVPMFGELDFDDPAVQAAFEACRKVVNLPGPGDEVRVRGGDDQ